MKWKIAAALVSCLAATAAMSEVAGTKSPLEVEQILSKYAAARGGRDAWSKIETMVWSGRIESEHHAAAGTTFVMSFKRPSMTRFEVSAPSQKAVHIYDGTRGWKLRQKHGGDPELQDYNAEELSFARDALGMDGPLMNYKSNGVVATLAGSEPIEGHKAYRLNLTLPSGATRRTWIDASTFLELRYDRQVDSGAGHDTVSVIYRDYRTFEGGVQIPSLIETVSANDKIKDQMHIDRVVLNPPLQDELFAKPRVRGRGAGAARPPTAPLPPSPH
jgi:outer membrane lipoprotein-sorting protein